MIRLIALLLLQSIALAAPPVVIINGPNESQVGDIIILDASETDAEHFAWMVDESEVSVPKSKSGSDTERLAEQLRLLGFKVERPQESSGPLTHLILNDGKLLILASYQGQWRVALATSNSDGIAIKPWSVRVTTGGNTPDVPPVDDPKVPDVIDTPKPPVGFGLKDSVREWLAKDVAANAQSQSGRVADVIDFFIQQVRRGAYPTLAKAEEGLVGYLAAEQAVGRMDKKGWTKFANKLNDSVSVLKTLGRVNSPVALADAMTEVVEGLR
ncbi:MAG TPA: hypothetical protein VNQ76_13280 [Planctomicrobium sp.]|nr:hypothetical protein [Planctomicrobium sp.]